MTTFKELGLSSVITKSLEDLEFTTPSPIQEKTIPFILNSKEDLTALAQTGTGKTAAYSLPILDQIKAGEKGLLAIILCPTRELCLQISQDIKKFTKYSHGVSVTAVYGGERINLQINSLKRGTNIIVGTPGRTHDLIRRGVLKLQDIKWLVLDEADEMLDMGFKDDLDAILSQTPQTRQTLLFSATMSPSVSSIARQYMTKAQEISAGEKNIGAEKVEHEYYIVQARDRFDALKSILDNLPGVYGILFCRTKNETQVVADKLKQSHYDAEALHGDISQNMRTKIMDRFKKKQIRLLVATDVAARGIDVNDLTHVINYNLPDQDESYTHRSGRTGRAQKSGVAISLVASKEAGRVRRLENIIGKKFEYKKVPTGKEVVGRQIDNFIEEVEKTSFGEIDNEEQFVTALDKFKKINKEDLIKKFIAHKFNYLNEDYRNSRDLNAQPKKERGPKKIIGSQVNFKINIGKKQGLDLKSFFALINSNRNLKGLEVGDIKLSPEYSFFSVQEKDAERVSKNLSGLNFKGTRIDISKNQQGAGNNRKPRPIGRNK